MEKKRKKIIKENAIAQLEETIESSDLDNVFDTLLPTDDISEFTDALENDQVENLKKEDSDVEVEGSEDEVGIDENIELTDLDLKEFDDLTESDSLNSELNELTQEERDLYYKSVGAGLNKKKNESKLAKLILINFMTFQNSTVEFHDGFNIVTGPNGSGKSVIFQAIKFVLGSNERDDRYSNWSGFIRDGTDYCSVEAHIKKGEEYFILKRRAVKDGSIEYYLSKGEHQKLKRVNKLEIAKSIEELGFEPDNKFCFIAQGKINLIWNQSPQDIARFIEDGINLSDFRKRINNEILAVKELQSKKSELETKRRALESELITLNPKYERYLEKLKIQAKLKELNKEKIWAKRETVEKELEEQELIVQEKNSYIQKYQNKKMEIEQDIEKNKEEIRSYIRVINDITNEINELDKEIVLIKTQIENKSSGLGALRDKIEKNQEEIKIYSKNQQNYQLQLEKDTKLLNEMEQQISKELIEINVNENKEKTLALIAEKTGSISNNLSELEAKIKHVQKESATKKERIKKLNSDSNKLTNKIQEIEKELQNSKTYQRHKEYISNIEIILKQKIQQAENRSMELKNQQKMLIQDIEEKKKELNILKEIASQNVLSERMRSFIAEIKRNNYDLVGPIGQFLRFDEKYRSVFEILILPENFNAFLTENSMIFNNVYSLINQFKTLSNVAYVGKKINENLHPKVNGSNFIGLAIDIIEITAKEPNIKNIIYSFLRNIIGDCIVVENMTQLFDFIKDNPKFTGKIIDLDGNIIDFTSDIAIANYGATQSILEQRKSAVEKIPELEKRIEDLEQKNSNIVKEKKEKDELIVILKSDLTILPTLLKKVKEIEDHKKKLERQNIEIENENMQIESLDIQLSNFEAEKQDIKRQILDITKGTEYENKDVNFIIEIPKLIQEIRKKIDEKRKKIEENRISQQEIQSKISQFEEKLKNVKETLERLQNTKKTLENEMEFIDEDTKKYVNEQIEKNARKTKKEKEMNEYKSKKTELENNLDKLNKDYLELSTTIVGLQKDNEVLIQRTKEIREELSNIDSYIKDSNVDKRDYRDIDIILRDIENTESELKKYRDCGEDIAARKQEVDTIVQEISNKSREIHEEIMKGESTIQTLKEQHMKVFKIAIKQMQKNVNEKFQKTNTMLKIKIKEQGDFDTLGIHVGVKDTSNNYRNIKAISGGQRTMVTLGIITTIQESNPTPLNMYDEADTHLDAKNGNTIYSIMKIVSRDVQILFFIPISDKPYVALSDKIIGITSQGQGAPSVIVYYKFNVDFLKYVKNQKELEETRKKEQESKRVVV